MAVADNAKRIEEARKKSKDSPSTSEATLKDVISKGPGTTDNSSRDFENALVGIGELYRDQKRAKELAELIQSTKSELSNLPKAKTAKIGMSIDLKRYILFRV